MSDTGARGEDRGRIEVNWEAVDRFATILADHHLIVSVRKSRGRDIRAACGQLIVEADRKSPAQQLARAAFGD